MKLILYAVMGDPLLSDAVHEITASYPEFVLTTPVGDEGLIAQSSDNVSDFKLNP